MSNVDFNDFTDAETLYDDLKSKRIKLDDAEKNQTEFESKLSNIRIKGNKLKEHQLEIENITNFYNLQE